jgi:hypothetical protein
MGKPPVSNGHSKPYLGVSLVVGWGCVCYFCRVNVGGGAATPPPAVPLISRSHGPTAPYRARSPP